ncbi:MAG: hypothetical protein WAM92_05995 [Mycobacterium sp.]
MGNEVHGRGGDDVTARVGASDSATEEAAEMRALLEQAEAEAAEAEAAAATARARVTELRSSGTDEETPAVEAPAEKTSRLGIRLRRPRWPGVAKAIAALVIAAALAGSGYILWQHHNVTTRNQRAAEFSTAASEGVTALTSLDFGHAKEDVQRIIDHSTGSFRDDYEARADDFVKVVESSKVVARGTVTATAVQSVSDDEAVVLVTATEEITNAAGNKQPRYYRFRVTVTRDGDQLKMSRVEFVP